MDPTSLDFRTRDVVLPRSDRDALYHTICDNPADDTPRLVYADWLQEHDEEPRAEFIRLQCRLAELSPADPDFIRVQERQASLLATDSPGWTDTRPPLLGGHLTGWHRGFPACLTPRTVSPEWSAFFERSPCRQVSVPESSYSFAHRLSEFPWPGWLEGLLLGECLPSAIPTTLDVLESRGLLPTLRRLLVGHPLSERGVPDRIDAGPRLDGLTHLTLATSVYGTSWRGYERVIGPNLRELRIFGRPNRGWLERFSGAGPFLHLHTLGCPYPTEWLPYLRQLASPSGMPSLAALSLRESHFDSAGFTLLAELPWRLRRLSLWNCLVGPDAAEALTHHSGFGSLQALNLRQTQLTERSIRLLAESPHLRGLRVLDLSDNPLTTEGCRSLFSSGLPDLIGLSLGGGTPTSEVPDLEGFDTALAALDLPTLGRLEMRGLPVGAAGAKALAVSASRMDLHTLRLRNCRIDAEGAATLFASPHLQKLRELDLRNNSISSGCVSLIDPTVMPELVRCNLAENQIPRELGRRLSERLGIVV